MVGFSVSEKMRPSRALGSASMVTGAACSDALGPSMAELFGVGPAVGLRQGGRVAVAVSERGGSSMAPRHSLSTAC